ncbi:MAG: MerR family transcriptional regulator [Actinomycetota bacterium]
MRGYDPCSGKSRGRNYEPRRAASSTCSLLCRAVVDPSLSSEEEKQVSVEMSFSGKRSAEIVGITYRQLDYWARTDLVRPSLADATGSGSRRRYSYKDLLKLKVIKTLLDAGLRLETVRDVFSYLEDELGEDVESANLVVQSSHSVVTRSGEELIDLVQQGQGVLNVLPLAGIKDEVDAKIVELPGTVIETAATEPSAPIDIAQ